jgi:hypothetical protein
MAKTIKKKAAKKANKIAVNGSFLDIMQAAVKQANNKSAKKKP